MYKMEEGGSAMDVRKQGGTTGGAVLLVLGVLLIIIGFVITSQSTILSLAQQGVGLAPTLAAYQGEIRSAMLLLGIILIIVGIIVFRRK
jgi:hypothetical protein